MISRNSVFVHKGKPVNVQAVARELGVDYVLEGSVRKAGDRVRVTVQLIDAETDRHIWAERYDRNLEDIFAIQDEVTGAIVSTLPGRPHGRHTCGALGDGDDKTVAALGNCLDETG